MAIIQISKIQLRRGRYEDILNISLSSAEPCFATDVRRLFIGNGAIAEGAVADGNTEILTEFSPIQFENLINRASTISGYGIVDAPDILVKNALKLNTPVTIAGISFDGSTGINIPFNNLIEKPSTIAGYGIIDANDVVPNNAKKLETSVKISGILFDGSQDIDIPFNNLVEKPSTIAGYGIIDGADILVNNALKLNTPITIAGISFDGSTNISIPFNNISEKPSTIPGYGIAINQTDIPTLNQDTTGNSETTNKLKTPILINSISFDGSTNIDIAFDNLINKPSTIPGYGIIINQTDVPILNQNTTGNSETTNKLKTPIIIAGTSFDGSVNIDVDFNNLINKPSTISGYGITINQTDIPTLNQDTTGNSETTNKLKTPVLINSISFDGSTNINIPFNNITEKPSTIYEYGIINGLTPIITKYTETVFDLGIVTDSSINIDMSLSNIFAITLPSSIPVNINIIGQPVLNEISTILLYVNNIMQTNITWTCSNSAIFVWNDGIEPIIKPSVSKYCYKFQWIYTDNFNDIIGSCIING